MGKGFKKEIKKMRKNQDQKVTPNYDLEDLRNYYLKKQQREEERFQEMLQELEGIKNREEPLGTYQEARLLIYSALAQCWEDREKIIDPQIEKQIKDAGEMLYQYGGMKALHDELLWYFIPKPLGGEIEIIWNGIGEWKA
jgi:hypothetical protein